MRAQAVLALVVAACSTELLPDGTASPVAPTVIPRSIPPGARPPAPLVRGEFALRGAPPEGTFAVVYVEDEKQLVVYGIDGTELYSLHALDFNITVTAAEGVYSYGDEEAFGWWPSLGDVTRNFGIAFEIDASPDGEFVVTNADTAYGPRDGVLDPLPNEWHSALTFAYFSPVTGHLFFGDGTDVWRIPRGHRVVDAERLCSPCRLWVHPFSPDGTRVMTFSGTLDAPSTASVWSTDTVGVPPLATFRLDPDVDELDVFLGPGSLVEEGTLQGQDSTWIVRDYATGSTVNRCTARYYAGVSQRFMACALWSANPAYEIVRSDGATWTGALDSFLADGRFILNGKDSTGTSAMWIATSSTDPVPFELFANPNEQWMDDNRVLIQSFADGSLQIFDVPARTVQRVIPFASDFVYVPRAKRLFWTLRNESPSTDGLYTMLLP